MNKKINLMLFCALFSGIAMQAEGAKNVRDYLKHLPESSAIKKECEECKGSGIFGFFKSSKERGCKKLNKVFNDVEQGVKYEPNFLVYIVYEFYASLLGGGNYHRECQQGMLKDAIRSILAEHPDELKWQELTSCEKLIERIPEICAARKQRKAKKLAEQRKKERERF